MATKKTGVVAKKKATDKKVKDEQGFKLSNIPQFTNEVKVEFGKITWPTRKNTIGSTVVVIVLVTIISCYLAVVDLSLGKLIGAILN